MFQIIYSFYNYEIEQKLFNQEVIGWKKNSLGTSGETKEHKIN